jgi:proteasome beta subunit
MENKPNKLNLDENTLNRIIRSSTTTVGIIVKDGVVVGTESQATAGYTVATKTAQKLFKINDYTCATISGGVADCQYVVNQLKALSRLKEVEEAKVPDTQYIASITRNILFGGRSYFVCMMIVGGYSLKKKAGILYGVDLLGTLYEEDWTKNMTKSAGINLIKTAISSSRERDAASGFDIQICTIDKNGFKQVQ